MALDKDKSVFFSYRFDAPNGFAAELKRARKAANLTQKQLAEKSGISLGAIQGYEQGKYIPKPKQVEKLMNVLGTLHAYTVEIEFSENYSKIPNCLSEIGEYVLKARKNAHYSTRDLSMISGVNESIIQAMETGNYFPLDYWELKSICRAARVSMPIDLYNSYLSLLNSEPITDVDIRSKNDMLNFYDKLTAEAQLKVDNYISDLYQVPKYRRKENKTD